MQCLVIKGIHHIQMAMPVGREAEARAFYGGALGMVEVAKPEALRGRGGCWFRAGDAELHMGVEQPFRPARKAHPAFRVGDLAAVRRALDACGLAWRRDFDLPAFRRVFVDDPFGNRVELLELT